MTTLIKVTEVYRIDSEEEAEAFRQKLKENQTFMLNSFSYKQKEIKSKGEIVDEYLEVKVQKVFNDPKSPDSEVEVEYVVTV